MKNLTVGSLRREVLVVDRPKMPAEEHREALRRSEQRFRATFEQAAVGMAHVAPDGSLLLVNQLFCTQLGYDDCSTLMRMRVQDITYPDDLGDDLQEMKRLLSGAVSTYTLFKRYFRRDGSIMWGRNTVSLVRTPEGAPEYFVSVLIDVTGRIEGERLLRESEALFRTTFEQVAVGMAQAGRPDTRWLQVNERFCEIVGYSREELLRMTPADITYPDDREMDRQQAEEIWSGRAASASREKRYVRKDGPVVWVQRTISVVRDAAGQALRFLVVIEDISERKDAQRKLRDTEQRYRLLFENANEGICVYRVVRDESGRVADVVVEDANPAQLEQTDQRREDIVGKRMSELYASHEVMRPYIEVAENVLRGGVARRFEVHLELTHRYFAIAMYPLEPDLWAAMGMDLTAMRRAQEELKRADELIRQAYEDVLDAVTGGKLALMTPDELDECLGEPLTPELPITTPAELADARATVRSIVQERFPALAGSMRVMNPLGEALNNVLKHAGGGWYRVFRSGSKLQFEVTDRGPGIDFRSLPKATLVSGFSSTATLGVGFTIMLQLADRVLLATEPGRTSVVLEVGLEPEAERPH